MPSREKVGSVDAELSSPSSSSHNDPVIEKRAASVSVGRDVESLKPAMTPGEVQLGDGGAWRAELMQSSWGKHGKFWIFFGLGLCMLA